MDGSAVGRGVALADNGLDTLASAAADRRQRRWAAIVCAASGLATAILVPNAASLAWPMAGFVPAYQACLIAVYGLTTYLLFAQYRHVRHNPGTAAPLLTMAAGALYTTLVVAVQMLTFPGIFAPGRLVGHGPETTTWLWTLWHLGPPLMAIAYTLAESRRGAQLFQGSTRRFAAWLTAGAAVLAALFGTVLVTVFVDRLPHTVDGDDYTALISSGIGPGVIALTALALVALAWTTRLRTVLQLWLAVSLVLLVADNILTLAGGARGTVGWVTGRIDALISGVIVLVVYLREVNLLYSRAELSAIERELARTELADAHGSLEIALDAAGMGDWELDLRTGLSRRSLRHDQIFGHPQGVPIWSRGTFLDHVLPEDRAAAEAALDQAHLLGRLEMDCRIRRADDQTIRWITLRGRTGSDATGSPSRIAGVVMDTTERHALTERAKQAERMEVVGQLTGGVAHDFNNLLTVIVGSLDLISQRVDDPAKVARLAANAMAAARRGAEVTAKLLAFSRRQMVRPQTLNLNRLLADIRPRLQQATPGGPDIVLELDPTLDPVSFDPAQFEAAIQNLVVNAADAMAGRNAGAGPITITTGMLGVVAQSDQSDLQSGEYARITVSDTGAGMDEITASRAFEPFFTTKELGEAAGLGLSQVYGFVKQAHGQVRLDSAPGRGTTVEILLPLGRRVAPRTEVPAGRPPNEVIPLRRSSGGEVVLVVEDEATVRDMAVESLIDLGYQTLVAVDAAEALDRLASDEKIDIMFSDVVMPGGMNGVQLAVEARRLRPRLKILLTSGYTALSDDRTVPSDVLVLAKPYRRSQLETKLRVVMGS